MLAIPAPTAAAATTTTTTITSGCNSNCGCTSDSNAVPAAMYLSADTAQRLLAKIKQPRSRLEEGRAQRFRAQRNCVRRKHPTARRGMACGQLELWLITRVIVK
jgi:hypothetical protein